MIAMVKSALRRTRYPRRGVTLLDVAIATALLSVVLVLAIQVVLSLSSSTSESLSRANARRQAVLATATVQADFAAATQCLPPPASSALVAAEIAPTPLLAFHADILATPGPDLVAYRVSDAGLERATAPFVSSCPTLADLGPFTTLLAGARAPDPQSGALPLAALRNGAAVTAPECTPTTAVCRVSELAVNVVAPTSQSGTHAVQVRSQLPGG